MQEYSNDDPITLQHQDQWPVARVLRVAGGWSTRGGDCGLSL